MANKKELTLRDEIALRIWTSLTAHYGLEDDDISPNMVKVSLTDCYPLADAALDIINQQQG